MHNIIRYLVEKAQPHIAKLVRRKFDQTLYPWILSHSVKPVHRRRAVTFRSIPSHPSLADPDKEASKEIHRSYPCGVLLRTSGISAPIQKLESSKSLSVGGWCPTLGETPLTEASLTPDITHFQTVMPMLSFQPVLQIRSFGVGNTYGRPR